EGAAMNVDDDIVTATDCRARERQCSRRQRRQQKRPHSEHAHDHPPFVSDWSREAPCRSFPFPCPFPVPPASPCLGRVATPPAPSLAPPWTVPSRPEHSSPGRRWCCRRAAAHVARRPG